MALRACKGFLRTHSSGGECTKRGREDVSAGTHQTLQALGGALLSLALPSHPKVRSNWNNGAIKTALTLCSSQRKAAVKAGF